MHITDTEYIACATTSSTSVDVSVSVCVHANVSVACLSPNWNLYNAVLRQHNYGLHLLKALQREDEVRGTYIIRYTTRQHA